jgi:EmrB/QacA subfamily drug resistance transporter
MGIFLATIDSSIVNVALPTLQTALAADFAAVQWVVLSYLLAMTTLLLVVGRLADMRGKKQLFAAGYAIFTLGSVLCGLSPTISWLIAARVVQGIGGALFLALGMAIVTEAFPPQERGRALGITGSIVSLGVVLGPTLGGLLLESLSWHWIFFVNLPVGIAGYWMVLRFLPDTQPAGSQVFDFGGAAALSISLLALLLALTIGQRQGFAAPMALALFGVAAVALIIFLLIELRHPQPVIDLRLFRIRLLTVNLVTGLATFVTIAGTFIMMPFYLENVLDYDVRQVGLLLAVFPIALGLTAPLSGALSDRFGTRPISVIGLVVLLLGYLSLSTLTETTTAVGYMLRSIPLGVGMGLFQSPNNSAIMGAAPRERYGVASGLLAVTRTLGQTVGIATLGAFWAARVFAAYGSTLPEGVTAAPPAAQVAGLQDTFLFSAFLIGLALLLAIWTWTKERKTVSGEPSAVR